MFSLDMRTAIVSYILITIISTLVITLLLKQYRNRYKGVHYMLVCFAFQTVSLIMILLRGTIPAWISFDLSNTISVAGIILFYIGLEQYTGQKSSLVPNLILLSLFAVIHSWFTFGNPNMAVRHLNVAVVWLLIFLQCVWLLLYRIPRSLSRLTRPVNMVCLAYCIVCIARIIKFIVIGHKAEDYFNSDWIDTIIILISQVLLILLIFSLEHMFSRQLLQDMKAEEEKFSKAFHTSPYGVAITRLSDGHIIEINKGVSRITGYYFDEVNSKSTLDLNLWHLIDERNQFVEEIKCNGKVYEREVQFKKKSGEIITALLSADIIMVNNERCLLSSFDDITERKKHVSELIKAKDKAEESDKLKTAFLHNISHEIRTPLNAIVGFSSLLDEPDLSSESKHTYIDLISRSSDHLLGIVTDIIEIANIEAGMLKLKKQEINLNKLLGDLQKQFAGISLEKGIELRITCGLPDNDSNIQADRSKLFQIISNLLSNAFKFTEKGQIELVYLVKKEYIEFRVKDTGIGIREDKHDKIFDRFYQVDSSNSRPYEGTGLGLSIIKSYVEIMGGSIWLESQIGLGTTFFFTLPFQKPGEVQRSDKEINGDYQNHNFKAKTILIAEDIESNYLLLMEFLSSTNVNLIHARNGNEAISICKSGRKIDLVLMDIKMPVMDGFEATGVITGLMPGVPVIAQTAYAFEYEKNRILPRGFIDYISKPYRKEDLLGLIRKYLS